MMRSSYLTVVPSRFIPPPIPIIQTNDGLKAPERTDGNLQKFPSLFVAQVLKVDDILRYFTIRVISIPWGLCEFGANLEFFLNIAISINALLLGLLLGHCYR